MTLLTSCISRVSLLVSCFALALPTGCTYRTATVPLASTASAMRIAVLPMENLSGKQAPLEEIRGAFISEIRAMGISVLDDAKLEEFMTRYRMRYTGGLDASIARAFRADEQIDAVLILSLELYMVDIDLPKIAMISRLVSTANPPSILWMKSVAMTGIDRPGLLGLGIITDPAELQTRVIRTLAASLGEYRQSEAAAPPEEAAAVHEDSALPKQASLHKGAAAPREGAGMPEEKAGAPEKKAAAATFGPKAAFQAPFIEPDRNYTVAVVPFFNIEMRKDAGDILLLHFVEELVRLKNLRVIEPGLVRNSLLNARVIMDEGISLADADFILNTFRADVVLSGKVVLYEDGMTAQVPPRVDFLVWGIQRVTKRVVWASESYNAGDDAVVFFDIGRVTTASRLASKMAAAVVKQLTKAEDRRRREEPLPPELQELLQESPQRIGH